jgi:hypothetical protein
MRQLKSAGPVPSGKISRMESPDAKDSRTETTDSSLVSMENFAPLGYHDTYVTRVDGGE